MFNWIRNLFSPHKHQYTTIYKVDHVVDNRWNVSERNAFGKGFVTVPKHYKGAVSFQLLFCKCGTYTFRAMAPTGIIPINIDYVKVIIEMHLKKEKKVDNIVKFINNYHA